MKRKLKEERVLRCYPPAGVYACPSSLGTAQCWRAGAHFLFSTKMQSAFRKFRRRMPPAPKCSSFSSHVLRPISTSGRWGKGRDMVSHLVLIELHGGYRESPKNKWACLPPGGPWACRGLGVITPGVITPGNFSHQVLMKFLSAHSRAGNLGAKCLPLSSASAKRSLADLPAGGGVPELKTGKEFECWKNK